MPGAPDDVAFSGSQSADARFGEFLQSRCLRILRRGFGARLLLVSPARPRQSDSDGRDTLEDAPIIYVHSKVSVFDDSRAILSSANLNGRSLRWDTEAGLDITRADQVAALRSAVMGAWLPKDHDATATAPDTAFAAWQDLALHNAETAPENRRGLIVPHDPEPARIFRTPAAGSARRDRLSGIDPAKEKGVTPRATPRTHVCRPVRVRPVTGLATAT